MFGSQNFQGLKNEESVRWYKFLSPFLYIHTRFKYMCDTDYTGKGRGWVFFRGKEAAIFTKLN